VGTRILVIEDNQTNMDLMVYLLHAYGYEPGTARNGREGVALALREQFDLVICDLEMPELNGYGVLQEMKAHPALRGLPLIAVTAYAMVGDRDRVLKAGFDGYITKPIYPEAFVQQVEAFLPAEKAIGKLRLDSDQESISGPLPERKSATILAVDDSRVNLSLIHSTLEPSGYTVVSAESVEEAMVQLQRRSFDVILSDLHMPTNNGFDFLRQVKAAPNLQSIPFVLFSASGSGLADISDYAKELGAQIFSTRPIEPEALLSMIDTLLLEASQD